MAAMRTIARPQSVGEEIANAVSHGLALLLALAALPIGLSVGTRDGDAGSVIGVSLFASTAMLLFAVSTLYHALPRGRAKRFFGRLDHAAIYVFIAGSYMPFCFGALAGAWGWSLFGVVWGLAALGALLKLFDRLRQPLLSTGLYVAMGWVALVALEPLTLRLPPQALTWLVAGGVAYTSGTVFYLLDSRWRYAHSVWHLFVVAGSLCHFVAAVLQGEPAS